MISINNDSKSYIGNELELFNNATNWKKYWGNQVKPFLGCKILEVGAGIGGTTTALLKNNLTFEKWVCIEPDPNLSKHISSKIKGFKNSDKLEIFTGFLSDYDTDCQFDSVLYIDVIEHIEHEKQELQQAVKFLSPGGKLIIIVPAHRFLFSEFDKAIGHYRRYDRRMLRNVIPSNTHILKNIYLDSLGLFASLINKFFLKQSYPTMKQIKFWDSKIIPISKIADQILFFNLGRSILLVAEKESSVK